MKKNFQSFDEFEKACNKARFYYVRPYGIFHRGTVYWDRKLPRKKGSVVRFFEDKTGPCRSLVCLDLNGRYLCNAYPVSWTEGTHPVLKQLKASGQSGNPKS